MGAGGLEFVKGHACGNDFLLAPGEDLPEEALGPLARAMCHRHHGIGADGLIAYRRTAAGASMLLRNADGSRAEVSGNGVRCLAAWIAATDGSPAGEDVVVDTEGGVKTLTLLDAGASRYTFRAHMGDAPGSRRTGRDGDGDRPTLLPRKRSRALEGLFLAGVGSNGRSDARVLVGRIRRSITENDWEPVQWTCHSAAPAGRTRTLEAEPCSMR